MTDILETCPYCGAMVLPNEGGATHRYMLSSAGCFAAFNNLTVRAYENIAFATVSNLVLDAYCLQHPGEDNPQAISHVAVHSISMYAQLEKGIANSAEINRLRQRATQPAFKSRYVWLRPPGPIWSITVGDVYPIHDPVAYQAKVSQWAQHTWEGWSLHHPQLLTWYELVMS